MSIQIDDITSAAADAAAKVEAHNESAGAHGLVTPSSTPVAPPYGFKVAAPFEVVQVGAAYAARMAGRQFSARDLWTMGRGIYYVDVATGNDSNAGGPLTPLKSLAAAQAKADVDVVYVAPGHYDRVAGGSSGNALTRSMAIIGTGPGETVISRRQSGLAWSQDGTYTNCWTTTRSSVSTVCDSTLPDINGVYTHLTLAADAATCNSTPGTYFLNGSTVYVHRQSGGAADATIWVLLQEQALSWSGDVQVCLENITICGDWYVQPSTTGQRPRVIVRSCKFSCAYNNGVTLLGTWSVIENCIAAHNRLDGFNYHAKDGVPPAAFEIGCRGYDNGLAGADNCNGTTIHDGGSLLLLNGVYAENRGPNVITSGDCEAWCIGCTASDSIAASTKDGFGSDGQMWLLGCTASGNTRDLAAYASGDYVRHRSTTFATQGGSGTCATY